MSRNRRILALLVISSLLCISRASLDAFQEENDMISKLAADGSAGGWRVGKACETCPRGLFATRAFKKGEVVGRIYRDKCIDLDTKDHYLTLFLFKVLYEPEVNQTYGDYLRTLPKPGELNCYLSMTPEQAAMMQAPEYSKVVHDYDEYIDSIVDELVGRGPEFGLTWEPTADTVRYYMSIVTTRAFDLYHNISRPEDGTHAYLCPVLDLLNNETPGNCERIMDHDNSIIVQALQDIQEGEELKWTYHQNLGERPDTQLLTYGYVDDQERPQLSGIDMPDFDYQSALTPSVDGDDLTRLTRSQAVAELERVTDRLESLPTTEEQDQSILESGRYKDDFFTEQIIMWRVLRKRALKQRIEALQKLLSEL